MIRTRIQKKNDQCLNRVEVKTRTTLSNHLFKSERRICIVSYCNNRSTPSKPTAPAPTMSVEARDGATTGRVTPSVVAKSSPSLSSNAHDRSSLGHVSRTPSQYSSTSQMSSARRHNAPLAATFGMTRHRPLVRSHTSIEHGCTRQSVDRE